LPLPEPIDRYLASCLPELSARTLEIRTDRAIQAARLPLLHRDPFDCCCRRQAVRMLIAQAQVEGMAIVSADRAFDLYDVEILSHD
jgi:PIN domain nuclease of toxin-antitoxin system